MFSDVTENRTVSVTAEHIARGVRSDCSSCPVALAVMDIFPAKLCIVTWDHVYVYPDEDTYSSYIAGDADLAQGPDEVWQHSGSNFINRFDQGMTVEPQYVELWLEKRNA
jgi:hypothetical protein